MLMDKEKLIEDLIRDEGCVPHAYQDTQGLWTIGVGRLIDNRRGGRLSQDEINYLLANDIDDIAHLFDKKIPWWLKLNEPRQRALANMCFNMGINNLLNFKITLGHLEAKRYGEAADEMLRSKWAKQVGDRAVKLAKIIREGK